MSEALSIISVKSPNFPKQKDTLGNAKARFLLVFEKANKDSTAGATEYARPQRDLHSWWTLSLDLVSFKVSPLSGLLSHLGTFLRTNQGCSSALPRGATEEEGWAWKEGGSRSSLSDQLGLLLKGASPTLCDHRILTWLSPPDYKSKKLRQGRGQCSHCHWSGSKRMDFFP